MKKSSTFLYLDWDSKFFEFSIARFQNKSINSGDIEKIKLYCCFNKTKLLQFECDVNDRESILFAEKMGFHFADFRINYKLNLVERFDDCILPHEFRVDYGQSDDIEVLREIAGDIYQYSRYYFDINFPRDKVQEFYKNWIQKSLLGQFDDFVLTLYFKDRPIGFVCVSLSGDSARFSLVGLNKEFSRQGLGLKFLKTCSNTLYDRGVRLITTVTQGRNIPAQNLYPKSQFYIDHIEIYYHYWCKNDDMQGDK